MAHAGQDRRISRKHAYVIVAALLLAAGCGTARASDMPTVSEPAAPAPAGKSTDTSAAARDALAAKTGATKFEFQAEVNRLMDIIIHSLYSNKDIFLRELISNASDALDKIRFLSLTDKAVLGEGEAAELDIRIWVDKEANVLYLRDRGIGMTREDLVKNLGTIAKSGTSAFLEQMQKGGDINLIGQFGVGFYSVYLVADWVEVVSKHNDDKQYIWASSADGSFTIVEDAEGEPLGRGTLLKIHLKPEAQEYNDVDKLKGLVSKYSEFINFPISIQVEKEVEVDEPEPEATEEAAKEDKKEEGDAEDVDDEEEVEEEKAPAAKKTEKRATWERVNEAKPLWLRSPSDVTEDEYVEFYKAISKDYQEPLTWAHFRAEGDVEFRALLFIPKAAPPDFYDKYYEPRQTGPKLYVRRVFISDDVSELLPKYLSFLKGVVDSDTLPLNVSREMLQQHSSLKTIRKKLVRKVLDIIRKMADDERKCEELDESDEARPAPDECGKFATFWGAYGRAIKLGVMEDPNNKGRLAKLLRFHTSASPKTLTSLEAYVGRMKEGQKEIYWVSGTNAEDVAKSPFTEALVAKGYEVVYFTEALDEYVMGHLTEFDDHKLVNAAKEDVQLSDDKEAEKKVREELRPLTKWWKNLLGDKVTTVKVSSRLATTPCVVVTGKYGTSANMERIMRAQAFHDPSRLAAMRAQRTLEVNPHHPLITALRDLVASDDKAAAASQAASVLYETALLESGFELEDVKGFGNRMYAMLGKTLGVELPPPAAAGAAAAEEAAAPEAKADSAAAAAAKEEL